MGDIHPKVILGCEKVLNKTIKILDECYGEMNFEKVINDMYDQMTKYSFLTSFKLPFYGIKFPEYESKRNLYQR